MELHSAGCTHHMWRHFYNSFNFKTALIQLALFGQMAVVTMHFHFPCRTVTLMLLLASAPNILFMIGKRAGHFLNISKHLTNPNRASWLTNQSRLGFGFRIRVKRAGSMRKIKHFLKKIQIWTLKYVLFKLTYYVHIWCTVAKNC